MELSQNGTRWADFDIRAKPPPASLPCRRGYLSSNPYRASSDRDGSPSLTPFQRTGSLPPLPRFLWSHLSSRAMCSREPRWNGTRYISSPRLPRVLSAHYWNLVPSIPVDVSSTIEKHIKSITVKWCVVARMPNQPRQMLDAGDPTESFRQANTDSPSGCRRSTSGSARHRGHWLRFFSLRCSASHSFMNSTSLSAALGTISVRRNTIFEILPKRGFEWRRAAAASSQFRF